MTAHLEVWKPSGRESVLLEKDRLTVGRAESNDVVLAADGTTSRLHMALERFASGWCARDLGSRNGTFVNGERIWSERVLRPGDEIRVGQTRLVYWSAAGSTGPVTLAEANPVVPDLTRREREVLLALCQPVLLGELFKEPASIRELARELVVTEAAIKQHLSHLFDKFGIHEPGQHRRVRLANEAIQRGAVKLSDLRDGGTTRA